MYPLVLLDISAKAAEIAARDPHGWILTVVCVSVVFAALLILYLCYSLIGKICQKTEKSVVAKDAAQPDESSDLMAAAVALALGDFVCGEVHDKESYVITIRK